MIFYLKVDSITHVRIVEILVRHSSSFRAVKLYGKSRSLSPIFFILLSYPRIPSSLVPYSFWYIVLVGLPCRTSWPVRTIIKSVPFFHIGFGCSRSTVPDDLNLIQ